MDEENECEPSGRGEAGRGESDGHDEGHLAPIGLLCEVRRCETVCESRYHRGEEGTGAAEATELSGLVCLIKFCARIIV